MRMRLYPRIVADTNILAGKPVIDGTQVAASGIIAAVAAGESLNGVANESGVSVDDVRAALEYAAQLAGEPVATLAYPVTPAPPEDADSVAAAEREATSLGLDPSTLTPLGRRLLALRAENIASGTPLLTWDEFDTEMAEMRRDYLGDDAE